MNTDSDNNLFLLLKQGNEDAFADLYKFYSPTLYSNLLKLTKDKDVAQDILHDIYVNLWEKRESIDIHTSFKSYLFITAKNMVYNSLRKEVIAQKAETNLKYSLNENYSHIEEDLNYQETQKIINDAIETLPKRRKEIYKLCKQENKSYQEVSDLLHISESTINDHMVKAHKHIKEHYVKFKSLYAVIIASFLL